jgi:phenylacetate-CoA ligase
MTKDDLMGNFDEIVTDPEVRLADANAHIAKLDGDAYFRDELHAVASGGSSGVRGVFVWGWDAWATVQLTAIRRALLDRIGDPELASRPPVAMIVAAENATHFTSAVSETFATGAVETHRFRVGLPLEEVVAGLNAVGGRQPRHVSVDACSSGGRGACGTASDPAAADHDDGRAAVGGDPSRR